MAERKWNELPYDLWLHIADFVWPSCYKFRDWVDTNKLSNVTLSKCSKAVDFLLNNPDRADIASLCSNENPKAQLLLWYKPYNINWYLLNCNEAHWVFTFISNFEADILKTHTYSPKIESITHYPGDIVKVTYQGDESITSKCHIRNLCGVCRNLHPKLTIFLKQYPELIYWYDLSKNPTTETVQFLFENQDKIDWYAFSANTCPLVIKFLSQNVNKIKWDMLSSNTSPQAIELLKLHPNKINWSELSYNECPQAIELLLLHPDKINLYAVIFHCRLHQSIKLLEAKFGDIDLIELASNSRDYISLDLTFVMNHIDDLLAQHSHPRYFEVLSHIPHYKAINILKQHPDKIDWIAINENPCSEAIELIQEYKMFMWNRFIYNKSHRTVDILFEHINSIDLSLFIKGLCLHTDNERAMRFLLDKTFPIEKLDIPDSSIDLLFEVDDVTTQIKNIKLLKSFNIICR